MRAWQRSSRDRRQVNKNQFDEAPQVRLTGWFWAAAVAGLLSLVATTLGVRLVPGWPEMGSRYDAPTGPPKEQDPADMEDVDLWRAIDQGRDPTDPTDY